MKKRGFTLIELLAVIVVLAIIALIATPIVMNTIKKSQKGAAERSADNYIEAVETAVATSRLDSDGVSDGTYTINEKGNLEGNGLKEPLTIEMSGNKPTSGTITIRNGQVTTDSKMTIGSYEVSYNQTNKKYEAIEKGNTTVEVLCKAVTTATTGNVPNGSFSNGDEYTCELGDNDAKTFFVLETNGDNVSLLMYANVDSNGKAITSDNIPSDKGLTAWCGDEILCKTNDSWDNKKGPLTAEIKLKESTESWTKLVSSQITLPNVSQMNKKISIEVGDWRVDYLGAGGYVKHQVQGVYGYWTSDSSSIDGSATAFDCDGAINNLVEISNSSNFGIRPVITLSKSQLR